MPVLIGTSGWQYQDWRGRLYPEGLAQRKWLGYYAARFCTVEVNSTFYRLPESSTFEHWCESTPDDFLLSVKASRYLTHVRRLRDAVDPVQRLLERLTHLGDKLGPILVQLPANFRVDILALTGVLEAFPQHVRVAFEPRHESWYVDEVRAVLHDHNAAFCLSDAPQRKAPYWRTADWGYLRFHEGRAQPAPCYGRSAIRTWAHRLAELWAPRADVFVYFNNDRGGCAVRDAHRFALAVGHAGLTATRVPGARESNLTRMKPA
jgi:uncharacterized protein YecE (DUF72 family)